MTEEEYKAYPDHEIFKTGLIIDSPEGCNMTNSKRMLRYVAKKGIVGDFAIYVGLESQSEEAVREYGDKVYDPANIRRILDCNTDLLKYYRF